MLNGTWSQIHSNFPKSCPSKITSYTVYLHSCIANTLLFLSLLLFFKAGLVYAEGVARGFFPSVDQRSLYNEPDLEAKPWWRVNEVGEQVLVEFEKMAPVLKRYYLLLIFAWKKI